MRLVLNCATKHGETTAGLEWFHSAAVATNRCVLNSLLETPCVPLNVNDCPRQILSFPTSLQFFQINLSFQLFPACSQILGTYCPRFFVHCFPVVWHCWIMFLRNFIVSTFHHFSKMALCFSTSHSFSKTFFQFFPNFPRNFALKTHPQPPIARLRRGSNPPKETSLCSPNSPSQRKTPKRGWALKAGVHLLFTLGIWIYIHIYIYCIYI